MKNIFKGFIFVLLAIGTLATTKCFSSDDIDTELALAVRTSDYPKLKDLLEHGANPNSCGYGWKRGSTYACDPAFADFVLYENNYLINHGQLATYEAILHLFVDKGLSLYHPTRDGHSYLTLAAERGSLIAADYLIKSGVDINKSDSNGNTPLTALVSGNNFTLFNGRDYRREMLELLLKNKANPNLRASSHKSPLMIAAEKNDGTFVEILNAAGARPDDVDSYGVDSWTYAYCSDDPTGQKAIDHLGGPKKKSITASQLNIFGYRAYKVQNYSDAARFFSCAIKNDDGYALAHYNLACTMALSSKNRTDEDGAFNPRSILSHLKRSIELSPERKKRALVDPDLNPIHETVFFKVLAGKMDLKKTEDIKALLGTYRWFSSNGCGGGISDDQLKFDESGKLYAGCSNGCEEDEDCVIAHGYSVDGNSVTLKSASGDIRKLIVSFDGVEASIKGVTADGSTKDEWFEFSGYHGSP